MTSPPPGTQGFEWLDLGPPDRGGGKRSQRARPSRRTLVFGGSTVALAIAVVVAVALSGGSSGGSSGSSGRHQIPSRSATSAPSTADEAFGPVATATAVPVTGKRRITALGHSLLGVTDGWDLFLRGPTALVRLQMAAGRVTVTPTPALDGGIAMLLTHDRALVVSSDFESGFSVPDATVAQSLAGSLAVGGNVYPGPVDGQFWQQITTTDITSAFELVDVFGRDLHQTITLPPTAGGPATADGSGYLIVQGVSGSYDARPNGLRRITTGQVIAVGPTEWVAEECDDVGGCSDVVVDKATWARQVIGPASGLTTLQTGAVSPDGAQATVIRLRTGHRIAVDLIQIATGAERTVADIPDSVFGDQIVAWSPDSRWLFVVNANGAFQVVDADTLQHVNLGVVLPPVAEIAVRPAPH